MSIKRIATICACLCALFAVVDFYSTYDLFDKVGFFGIEYVFRLGIVDPLQNIALLTIAFFFFVLRNQTNK